MRYFVNRLTDYAPGVASAVLVDTVYWKEATRRLIDSILKHLTPTLDNCDGGLYVGCAGVAYALYYLSVSEPFADLKDPLLAKAREYIDVAVGYTKKKSRDPETAFLLGSAGVWAVGSVICDATGDPDAAKDLRARYRAVAGDVVPIKFLRHGSDELFVGRAGYLCGARFLNHVYDREIVSKEALFAICRSIVQSGRDYAKEHRSKSALMYAYYDTEYLGAAHGLSSILQMLLCFPEFLKSEAGAENYVHESVDFLCGLMQTNGNIPPAMDEVKRRRPEEEELVHWCHGAPGIVYLFAMAYLYFKDDRYLDACVRCGELTWQRGLLRKGPGICHGIAGSGYVFLLLYRLTNNDSYLHRALKFAEFMQTPEFREARTPDSPYSLYEGLAGTVCFLTDLMQPHRAHFPFFDVFT